MTLDPGLSESGSQHTSTKYQPFSVEEKRPGQATVIRSGKKTGHNEPENQLELHSPGANSAIWMQLFPSHFGNSEANTSNSNNGDSSVTEIQLGHFHIQKRIGSGGMGAVFSAIDLKLARVVALKVLGPELSRDNSAVKRFQNEAKSAAQLDHDNIARIYFSGEDQGLHYIAFEFVEGSNIRDLIEQEQRLPIELSVNYILQLASALRHTRTKGVVHRDIKPSNIIIQKNGRAKLVDWGLARAADAYDQSRELTVDGTTLGTFDYISPEQARDPRKVDVRSDIYSLGCTFYHMLTGEAPYGQGTMLQKLLDHNSKETPDPRLLNPEISSDLARVIMKMMTSTPDARYQTPEELIQELIVHAQHSSAELMNKDSYIFQGDDQLELPFWKRHLVFLSTCFFVIFGCLLSWQVSNRSVNRLGSHQRFPIESVPVLNLTGIDDQEKIDDSQFSTENISIDHSRKISTLNPQESVKKPNNTFIENTPPQMIDITKNPNPANVTLEPDTLATAVNNQGQAKNPADSLPTLDVPFSVIDGLNTKSFMTLGEAVEFAPDGSIIEVRASGTTLDKPLLQKQIQFRNKSLVLRGKPGNTPVLAFNDESYFFPGSIRLLQGAKLKIQNMHLVFTCDHGIITEQVSLFNLQQTRGLTLDTVSITLNNPARKPCQLILLSSNSDEAFLEIPRMNDVGVEPISIELTDCVVRGYGDFLTAKTSRAVNIILRKVALGIDGTLIRHEGSGALQREDDLFSVELDHISCFTKHGILTADVGELPRKLPKINIKSRNSIFDNLSTQSVSLINMLGTGYEIDLISRLNWVGEQNFYQNYYTMLDVKLIGTEQNDFVPWTIESWKTNWGTNENTPNWNKIVWHIADHSLSPRLWSLAYFKQDSSDSTLPIAQDAGANVDLLPKVLPLDSALK